jgi:hypothetical protein
LIPRHRPSVDRFGHPRLFRSAAFQGEEKFTATRPELWATPSLAKAVSSHQSSAQTLRPAIVAGENMPSTLQDGVYIRRRHRALRRLAPFIAIFPFRLDMILRICGSDKEDNRPDRGHHYGMTYHMLFRNLKYSRLSLLEIGVGGADQSPGGESLLAWRCFFPFSKIVGCDNRDKRYLAGGKIQVHVVDQSSEVDLARIASDEGPFDIIIDDGSHVNFHQILTFKKLFNNLKEFGIYIVEDTQTSYWPEFGGKRIDQQDISTCMGYFLELANYLNYPEFPNNEGISLDMLNLSKQVKSIHFHHNLIVVNKDSRQRYSNRYRSNSNLERSEEERCSSAGAPTEQARASELKNGF